MTLLLLIAFSAFTILAVRNLQLAFFLFVGMLPSYLIRFSIGGIPTTALEILFIILFVVWMFRREKRLVDITGWRLLLLAWITVATVSVFISPNILSALGIWKAYFIEPALFFILANDILRTKESRQSTVIALAWSAIAVGGLALIQTQTHFAVPPPWDGTEGFRSTSFYGFPNAVGLFLAPMIPLFFGQLIRCRRDSAKKYTSTLFLTAIILSFAGILAAESEGAQIAVLAGLLTMGLVFRKSRWWTVGLASLGAAVLLLNPAVSPKIIEKMTLEDWSGRVRKEIWVETSDMLSDHVVFGAGLGGYPTVFAPYHKAGHIEIFQYPHNIFLNFWSEVGLAGVILFFLMIAQFFRTTYRAGCRLKNADPFAVALSGAMIAILVHGLVDVPYLKNDLAIQFWLIIALATSLAARKHVSETE